MERGTPPQNNICPFPPTAISFSFPFRARENLFFFSLLHPPPPLCQGRSIDPFLSNGRFGPRARARATLGRHSSREESRPALATIMPLPTCLTNPVTLSPPRTPDRRCTHTFLPSTFLLSSFPLPPSQLPHSPIHSFLVTLCLSSSLPVAPVSYEYTPTPPRPLLAPEYTYVEVRCLPLVTAFQGCPRQTFSSSSLPLSPPFCIFGHLGVSVFCPILFPHLFALTPGLTFATRGDCKRTVYPHPPLIG